MLKVELIAVGTRSPAWVSEAVEEYSRRMKDCTFSIREIRPADRRKPRGVDAWKAEEAALILNALVAGARVIAMDLSGRHWSTEQLAGKIENWKLEASHLQFLVGGPDGLDAACLSRADEVWSLSHLTFPHQLVRVILAEQIYRALSFIANHPYHK